MVALRDPGEAPQVANFRPWVTPLGPREPWAPLALRAPTPKQQEHLTRGGLPPAFILSAGGGPPYGAVIRHSDQTMTGNDC